jgi:hypothetical protein
MNASLLRLRVACWTDASGLRGERLEIHVLRDGTLLESEDLPNMGILPAERVEYRDPTTEELAQMGLASLGITTTTAEGTNP